MKIGLCASAATLLLIAGSVHAAQYSWDWNASMGSGGGPGSGQSDAHGVFESIHAEYDDVTDNFVWNVVFSNQITRAYTLAVSPGPNPKGHAGELALIYFDAKTSLANPKLTVYAYNGLNLNNSWSDGNGAASGSPLGDLIHGANDTSFINSIDVIDTPDGKRTFTLDIDASAINGHSPLFPGPEGPGEWTGLRFAERIGLWMHTYTTLNPTYGNDGRLCSWNNQGEGYLDGQNFVTVPLPAGAWLGMAGLGVVGFVARRRKARMA
jgi:hypothetical protein